MKQALVYSNGGQESERAVMVLEACGQDVRQFLLGIDFTHKQFKAEFGEEAEYPQVNVGFRHIGGLKETLNYFKDNNIL